jgi:hypothetical protein
MNRLRHTSPRLGSMDNYALGFMKILVRKRRLLPLSHAS